MYTVQPSDGDTVTIETYPPDLVEVGIDENDGTLYFKFNADVAAADPVPDEAGMVVNFPASQLRSVKICCDQTIQIKDGFTDVQELVVNTGAMAQAKFSNAISNMLIEVSDGATATVEVEPGRSSLNVEVIGSGGGTFVDIGGDVSTIVCSDRATCTVTGRITDTDASSVEGFSELSTDDCFGIDVEGGSTCSSNPPSVSVDVEGPLTMIGVEETCVQGGDLSGIVPAPTVAPTVSPAPTPYGYTYSPTEQPVQFTRFPTSEPDSSTSFPSRAPISTSAAMRSSSSSWWMLALASGSALATIASCITTL
jgi:hypothetical protein